MSEKIPYEQVMERMKSDIGYIAIEAYQSGYKDCETKYCSFDACRNRQAEYQRGLEDMHKAIQKISNMSAKEKEGVIDGETVYYVVNNYTANKIMEKIKAHEEKQKVNDFKVGDKVVDNSNAIKEDAGVITHIKKNSDSVYVMWKDGSSGIRDKNKITKTGEHTNSVEELLAEMKGEQRNCHTCKHQMTSYIKCVDCRDFGKWEPKEVTE